jgi:hypothetical protein
MSKSGALVKRLRRELRDDINAAFDSLHGEFSLNDVAVVLQRKLVALDLNDQIGVRQSDAVPGGGAIHAGVSGAGETGFLPVCAGLAVSLGPLALLAALGLALAALHASTAP